MKFHAYGSRWSVAYRVWFAFIFIAMFVAICGCSADNPQHSTGSEESTDTEVNDRHPWVDGEDCRNWGCAEKLGAHESVVAPPSNAITCTLPSQCPNGFCVDGVCCDSACTGACKACTAAKKGSGVDGVCGTIALYGDPDNECPDAACDGTGNCKSYNGGTCALGATCLSGYCVDGFCCGNACTSTCQACSIAKRGSGYNGQCGNIGNGTDPDNECTNGNCNGSGACTTPTNLFNGMPCSAGAQCLSGYCVDGVCCGNACTETCRACTVAKKGSGYDGQCGNIGAGADPDNECTNGDCNGSMACTTPVGLAIGSACSGNAQCTSGFCADGVCCNSACAGTCSACTAVKKGSGADGTCGFIASGANPDNECVGGKCSGTGICQYYNGATCSGASQCLSGYCADGYCCGASCTETCRACSAAKKGGGTNGVCGTIAVNTDPDNECVSGDCNGSGVCTTPVLLGNGSACSAGAQCTSGFCADGVCCNSACTGTCSACTAAKKGSGANGTCGFIAYDTNPDNECINGKCSGSGTCQYYNGITCAGAAGCLSGYCVDGFCCGAACTETCRACSAAKKGGGTNGVCGNIAATTDPDNECALGDCNGSGVCTTPVGLPNGSVCGANSQCTSNNCVDGLCCNTACTATCFACNVAGHEGTCHEVPWGQDDLAGSPACNGVCDGYGACFADVGDACTAGSDCLTNICDNLVCDIEQATSGPLDWLTAVVATNPLGSANIYPEQLVARNNGSVFVDATEQGTLTLAGTTIQAACCWSQILGIDFTAAGAPSTVSPNVCADGFGHSCRRFVARTQSDVESVTTYYNSGPQTEVSTSVAKYAAPSWSRDLDIIESGTGNDAGHSILLGQSNQSAVTPLDWGDGVGHYGPRLVKYDPSGAVTLNVPSPWVLGSTDRWQLNLSSTGEVYASKRTGGTMTIAKANASGVVSWTKSIPAAVGASALEMLSVAIDASDNLLVAFNFTGSVNLGNGALTATGTDDLGLAKLDSSGNVIWQNHHGSVGFDLKRVFMTRTGSSDMAISGFFSGSTNFGDGPLLETLFVAKFDTTGTIVWHVDLYDTSHSIVIGGNDSGAVFLTSSSTLLDFGWGPILYNTPGIILAKYGSTCALPGGCQVLGAPCGSNAQCNSNVCVDGVCCDNACTGLCEACSASKKGQGTSGTCGPIVSGADPDNECANGHCGGDGTCDNVNGILCGSPAECISNQCVDGYCCNNACTGLCQACSAAKKGSGTNGTCDFIAAGSDPDVECPGTTCSGSASCSANQPNGASCTTASQCSSGFCIDGVCCNSQCSALCNACSTAKGAAVNGTCGPISQGGDPDNDCPTGYCDGVGACSNYNGAPCTTGAPCISGICVDGFCCNGPCTGTCYSCSAALTGNNNGTCAYTSSGLDPDNECFGTCSGSGYCLGANNGVSCTDHNQCLSNNCADGVCCNTMCAGVCEACSTAKKGNGTDGVCGNIAMGTDPDNECALTCSGNATCSAAPNGAACISASECISGFCVDHVCCGQSVCTAVDGCHIGVCGAGTGTCSQVPRVCPGGGSCAAGVCTGQCTSTLGLPGVPSPTTGAGPSSIAAADLNGNGRVDLAVTNKTSNTVSILLDNGNGTYAAKVDYATGNAPVSIAANDLNGDGKIDLVVANYNSNTVSVFLNNGNGTYAAKIDYTTGSRPMSVAAADLNGDGRPDLAVTNYTSNTLSVFLNNGSGSFAAKVDYATGTSPKFVEAADLNGDGKIDLAVANYISSSVSVLFNNGNGTFATKVDYTTNYGPSSVAAADLNGDGKIDLAVGADSSGAQVLLNNGNGTFAAIVVYPVYSNSTAIKATDLNGDGHADLVLTAYYNNAASVLLNNGNGTFAARIVYGTGKNPSSLASADLNADGKMDLAVANSAGDVVDLLINAGNGTLMARGDYGTDLGPQSVASADLNGDGNIDLATANHNGESASVLLNNGNGTFATRVDYTTGYYPSAIAAADLNGDGYPDLAVLSTGNVVSIFPNNGNGTFAAAVDFTMGSPSDSMVAKDLNGDGYADLIGASSSNDTLNVLLNNGNGTFAVAVNYSTGDGPYSVFAADLNGDGYADLTTANITASSLSVFLNNGDGTFAPRADYWTSNKAKSVTAADLNGDGYMDLAAAITDSNAVNVLLNNGNGTFATGIAYATAKTPNAITAADPNGDGYMDLVVANENGTMSVLLNNGNGTLAPKIDYATGAYGSSITAADLNNDGQTDFAIVDYVGQSVAVMLRSCLP